MIETSKISEFLRKISATMQFMSGTSILQKERKTNKHYVSGFKKLSGIT